MFLGFGHSLAQDIALKSRDFNEDFSGSPMVAGGTIVGALIENLSPGTKPSVGAVLPAAWAGGDFCVSVRSVGGHAAAVNTYWLAPSWNGGYARIPFPTAHPDRWAALSNSDVAVLVAREPCSADIKEIAASTWNGAPKDEGIGEVRILINSNAADRVVLFAGSDPHAVPFECAKVEARITAAFDYVCAPVEIRDQETALEIRRFRYGNDIGTYTSTIFK